MSRCYAPFQSISGFKIQRKCLACKERFIVGNANRYHCEECKPNVEVKPKKKVKRIVCFHELGYKKDTWICNPNDFRKFLSKNPNIEIHFDDGRLGAYFFGLDILHEFNIKAKFFIVPEFVLGNAPSQEKYSKFIGPEQILNILIRGHTIGSHSFSHFSLLHLSDNEIMSELVKSKEYLESITSSKITEFSYPFGNVNDKVKKLAEKVYEKCYSLDSELGIKRELFNKGMLL